MEYTLRKAKVEDIAILDAIHTNNMKSYVEQLYPWNPRLFRNNFIPDHYDVIEINNLIIGLMKVVSSETEIYLAEIQIIQDYQKQGIGTNLIQSLIQEAQISNKKLWLKVLKNNPAKKLYQRLGFIKQEELAYHFIMVKLSDI
ncbi:MAG: GNAT family N-acetyltransferase [Xenococcaceae cyanobacterium MO_167.B52]|nr:GNAT family N-acetyltransferase [Xenococcaceae cyanobacterium MO_167.B52]